MTTKTLLYKLRKRLTSFVKKELRRTISRIFLSAYGNCVEFYKHYRKMVEIQCNFILFECAKTCGIQNKYGHLKSAKEKYTVRWTVLINHN